MEKALTVTLDIVTVALLPLLVLGFGLLGAHRYFQKRRQRKHQPDHQETE